MKSFRERLSVLFATPRRRWRLVVALAAMFLLHVPALGRASEPPPTPRFSGRTYTVADEGPESFTGLLVLDDRDQGLGATSTGDALSLISESGEVTWTTTGFSICETIGGYHRIAVDPERRRIYVAENMANRVTALDFAGRRRLEIVGMHASSIAVDVQWGHLWVTAGHSIKDGETLIFDSQGTLLNTLPVYGVDIVKASDADGVWMSGSHLRRVSSAGKILFERKDSIWCEPTLCTCVGSDGVWVGERTHPQVAGSASRIRRIRSTGEIDLKLDLPGDPYVVVSDSEGVWAGGYHGLRRVSNGGDLGPVVDIKVVAAERVARGDGVHVASREEIFKVSGKGEIISRRSWPRATTLLAR